MFSVIFFRCTSITLLCSCGITCNNENQISKYLDRTLEALNSALKFFDREYNTINLDAVISTKAAEGQLLILERKIQNGEIRANSVISEKITSLRSLAGHVTDKAIPSQLSSNPSYYLTFSPALKDGFWNHAEESRILPLLAHIWPYREDETIDGPTSNGCIGEMLGTQGKPACKISSFCWKTVTTPGFYGYSLSHQLLYTMLAQMNGCSRQMDKIRKHFGQPDVSKLQKQLCANMMAEVEKIVNDDFPWNMRDLFMEDSTFCGILGFGQFFRLKWLEHILSWQNPQSGCYDKQSIFGEGRRGARRKRSERLLNNGCLAHLTAMAITCLSQYVRYLLEAMSL